MHPEYRQSRGLAGHSGGNEKTRGMYSPNASLSRAQDLVVGFFAMAQSPFLDDQDQAMAWAGFDLTLRQLVGVRHGI